MSSLYSLISFFPLKILYSLSTFLSTFLPFIYRGRIVRKNLMKSFPDMPEGEIQKIHNSFYINFCDLFFEIIKSYSISESELSNRVNFKNFHVINEKLSNNKKVLVFASHQCNWEWLLLASQLNLSTPLNVVYKRISNKKFDKVMMDSRSRFGSVLIDSKKALLYLKRNLKDVNVLAVVADQSPIKKNRKSWRKLLNQDTAFFKSVEYLPRIMNSYVYFASMQRTKRGHYSVNFDLISEPNSNSKKDILSEYVLKLENQIKSKPDEWLWTHNRWKFTQDDI